MRTDNRLKRDRRKHGTTSAKKSAPHMVSRQRRKRQKPLDHRYRQCRRYGSIHLGRSCLARRDKQPTLNRTAERVAVAPPRGTYTASVSQQRTTKQKPLKRRWRCHSRCRNHYIRYGLSLPPPLLLPLSATDRKLFSAPLPNLAQPRHEKVVQKGTRESGGEKRHRAS